MKIATYTKNMIYIKEIIKKNIFYNSNNIGKCLSLFCCFVSDKFLFIVIKKKKKWIFYRPRQHFILFAKFKLQKLPYVKLITSSKYWIHFCKIAAIKSTQYLKLTHKKSYRKSTQYFDDVIIILLWVVFEA